MGGDDMHFDHIADALIVGTGPAGAAAALALKRNWPDAEVVMLERQRLNGPPLQQKLGESLHPTAWEALERLGLWDDFRAQGHRQSWGSIAVWGSDALHEADFMTRVEGHGWQLQRGAFDAWLRLRASEAGAVCYGGVKLLDVRRCSGGLAIQWLHHGKPRWLRCRAAIDASGRRAVLARRLGARVIASDQLMGAARFCTAAAGAPSLQDGRVLVEACEEGWWYSAGLPAGQAVAAFMTDPSLLRRHRLGSADGFSAALSRSQATRQRLVSCEFVAEVVVRPAGSRCLSRMLGPRWLAVGDAACCFDPLSSHGLNKALHSGVAAGEAAARVLREDRLRDDAPSEDWLAVAQEQQTAFTRFLRTQQEVYRQERRFDAQPFWHRRQQRLSLHPDSWLEVVHPQKAWRLVREVVCWPDMAQRFGRLAEGPQRAHVWVATLRAGVVGMDTIWLMLVQRLVEQEVLAVVAAPARNMT